MGGEEVLGSSFSASSHLLVSKPVNKRFTFLLKHRASNQAKGRAGGKCWQKGGASGRPDGLHVQTTGIPQQVHLGSLPRLWWALFSKMGSELNSNAVLINAEHLCASHRAKTTHTTSFSSKKDLGDRH